MTDKHLKVSGYFYGIKIRNQIKGLWARIFHITIKGAERAGTHAPGRILGGRGVMVKFLALSSAAISSAGRTTPATDSAETDLISSGVPCALKNRMR